MSTRIVARSFAILGLFLSWINPAFAIPPPDTLALIGGSLVYPGLLVIGVVTVLWKYVWIKTNLYLLFRMHLAKILGFCALFFIILSPPIFNPFMPSNHPANVQTIEHWKQSNQKFVFVDIRSKKEFDKVHVLNAINFPNGDGLANYLSSNVNEKVVLYCEVGFRTSVFTGIDVAKSVVNRSLEEEKLFYFPGGIYELQQLGEASPVSLVINFPTDYANYLLKKPNFTEIKNLDDIHSEYTKINSQNKVPIINTTLSHEPFIEKLKVSNKQFYFTEQSKTDPNILTKLLMFITLVFATVFILRKQEFFNTYFSVPSKFTLWKNALISLLVTTIAIPLNLFSLFIPYDFDYHAAGGNLFAHQGYLILIYSLFAVVLLAHLTYPSQTRLNFLRSKISNLYAPKKYESFFHFPRWEPILIVSAILYFLLINHYSVSATLVLTLFLLIPLMVDLLLYGILGRYRNTPADNLKLIKKMRFKLDPKGTASIQILSQAEELFSETKLSGLTRKLLLLFQQDFDLSLDNENKIVAVKLHANQSNPHVIARHILLRHHQIVAGNVTEKRFSSTLLQDVFANPTPLLLDILKLRWDKKGGYIAALNKLGISIAADEKSKQQTIGLSNRIYLDQAFEKAIFSGKSLGRWIRKKIIQMKFHLAFESILEDFHTLIAPRTQLRLLRLTESLLQPQSNQQLKRITKRALTTLCRESAMWQYYASVLHQHALQQLQVEAEKSSVNLAELITPSTQVAHSSYYQFASHQICSSKKQSYYQIAFAKTEFVRSKLRELQLQEWSLLSQLLDKYAEQLKSPIKLVYLLKEDFYHLPTDSVKLVELLEYRYQAWKLQNEWPFPVSFSLNELEQNSAEQSTVVESLRVAGNQKILIGNAVIFHTHLQLDNLPKSSILIADNILPEQVILCQHIRAIIIKQGGYLSHSAIIAREKNIAMIAQFDISNIKDHEQLIIHSGNQITHNRLESDFLESSFNQDIGNKAQRIAVMTQKGFNIPTAIILKQSAIEKIIIDNNLEELQYLIDFLTEKTESIIARSSTNLEDSSDHSYAGLFYSEPNIKTREQLIAAIIAAQQNVFDRSKIMKDYSGDFQLTLNLILQAYVKGQLGGVLFTESLTPGLMYVEIAASGAEGVTQGNGVIASAYFDEHGQTTNATGDKNILTQPELQVLFQLGRELEALFGKPQDIEWVFANQQFHIIQSRDINYTG